MKHILCIDIGGTRIKSAVLPERPTFEQARHAPTAVIRTLGWLNHSLPDLINPRHWPGLANYYREQGVHYDAVALSVPGPVSPKGQFMRPDLVHGPAKVPALLLDAMEKVAGCPVSLIKDADAWMLGFQAYAEAEGTAFDYPAVLMAFGTGAGISAATSKDRVLSIEASARPVHSWRLLAEASGYNLTEGWHVHNIIGRPFFSWVEEHNKAWDHLRIRDEYSKRVKAAMSDILPWIEHEAGAVKTLILTGGNAEYVSVRRIEETGCKVISLTDRLSTLPPDLITVLGVEASSRKPRPHTLV